MTQLDEEDDLHLGPRLTFRRAETITPTKPVFLWERHLVAAGVQLLVSRQGIGKSTLASWAIGNLSRGRPFPGDRIDRDPINCAMLSLEEPDERLVARLHATGADLSRVLIIGDIETFDEDGRPFRRPWRLPKDCDVLEEFLTNNEVGFVVVDGLGYSVQGDSHNYGAVGAALSSLAAVAERTGCSILGLTHPPKGGSDPATAAIGSTAWTAVARIVWVLGIDPDDETECRRVMRVSKSNFKMPDDGLAFIIGDDERFDCGYVTGVTTSSVSAEALVAASVPGAEKTEREEARDLVRSILKAGAMETSELLKLTRAAGVSDRTVERARRDLGVRATPRHDPGTGKMTGWMVELPTSPPPSPPTIPFDGVGGVGGVGTTRDFSHTFSHQSAQTASPPKVGLDNEPTGPVYYQRDEF
ncbi:MAG TPA: AAA family ATPase [Acidimicrobiales bacterium]|nr:AAA family ATPase [Acidimicrobiales bacterium]